MKTSTEKVVDTSDDLYGDLDEEMNHQNSSNTNIRNDASASSANSEAAKNSYPCSNDAILSLEKKIKRLEGENETLKRNMGTLYRTAKLELDRKDAMIADLERQLQL